MTTRMHERTRFRPRLGLCFVDDPRSTTAARREARSGRNLAALAATSTFCLSDRACFCSVTLLCFSLSFLDLSHSLCLSLSLSTYFKTTVLPTRLERRAAYTYYRRQIARSRTPSRPPARRSSVLGRSLINNTNKASIQSVFFSFFLCDYSLSTWDYETFVVFRQSLLR